MQDEALPSEYKPSSQGMQRVEPLALAKVPHPQSVHSVLMLSLENVPGSHMEQILRAAST